MALVLKQTVYKTDDCSSIYTYDSTGVYSSTNLGGFGLPNLQIITFNSVAITLTLPGGTTVVYNFTLGIPNAGSMEIDAATMTVSGGSPVDILAMIQDGGSPPVALWPFTSTIPFNVTPSFYDSTAPSIEDGVYSVTYSITDNAGPTTYTTIDGIVVDCATSCCIDKALAKVNLCDDSQLCNKMIPSAYLKLADVYKDTDLDKANDYLTKASTLCEGGCGCEGC